MTGNPSPSALESGMVIHKVTGSKEVINLLRQMTLTGVGTTHDTTGTINQPTLPGEIEYQPSVPSEVLYESINDDEE